VANYRVDLLGHDGELFDTLEFERDSDDAVFHEPFRDLIEAGLPPMVPDGEIAVPDDRGVTHIDALSEVISARRPDQLA
jgi:hypothetical protein